MDDSKPNRDCLVRKSLDEMSTNQSKEKIPETELLLNESKQLPLSEKPPDNPDVDQGCKRAQRPNDYMDHGWAWIVMLGSSLMHFLVGGYSRSYSLVYMYLLERFDSSAAVTAWVGGASSAIRMLASKSKSETRIRHYF